MGWMNPCCCFGSSCFPLAKSEGLELIFKTLSASAEHAGHMYVELGARTSKCLLCVQICSAFPMLQDLIFSLALKAKDRNLLVWE